ncbi:MAG: hypothetical protein KDC37_05180, partial [Flavobacteriales bacterium]|nr:hypothetical protein [Flavobacteriales bacterium]
AQLLEKGPARPIKDENTRLRIAASLRFVDIAVLFDEPTPLELISSIQPDVLVKGGDYNPDSVHPSDKQYIVGSDIVRNNGGQVYALPFLSGHSTTALEQKILKAHRDNGKG